MLKREEDIKTLYETEQELFNMTSPNGVLDVDSVSQILENLDNVILSILDIDYNLTEQYKQDIKEALQNCTEGKVDWVEFKELLQAILLNCTLDKVGSKLNNMKYELDLTKEQKHIPHID